MNKRLLLIDGHSMAYRAFYALPLENFTTATGQHTNAIYGFATMLLSLLATEKPTHVAVAFDVSRKSFRTQIFPEYKANRSKTPIEFGSQMKYLHDLVDAFGISVFEVEGFEADDILATIAKRAEAEGADVLICTGDRDSFALVTQKITVLYPKRGVSELTRMTPVAVQEKYGMTPSQYPDFAALRGDPSDNLPSIPGVGEKTAAKWIIEYGTLNHLIANSDELPGKAGQSLRDSSVKVLRNRELTQLIDSVPIDLDIDKLAWLGPNENKIDSLFEILEFKILKDRLKPFIKTSNCSKEIEPKSTLFAQEMNLVALSTHQADAKIAAHNGSIAISYSLINEKLHSYAVALTPNDVFIVEGSNMGDWTWDSSVKKIIHDSKTIARIGNFQGIAFDTSIAAYLLNPGIRTQDLTNIQLRWGDGSAINSSTPEQELLTSARALFFLQDSLTHELNERNLFELFKNVELPVANLLAKMEKIGIAVDRNELERLFLYFEGEVNRETRAAHACVGHEFNVASPKQLQAVLFGELKLPKTKKIKTGYTTDADSLDWLLKQTNHPLLTHLLRIRETKKLATTVNGLIAEIAADGRIHTHFGQTVTSTGRLSSTGPNLQNIPVRTNEGRRIRNAFVAGHGYVGLLTADYSQIEMRIMAHLSNDKKLLTAFESGEDLHASIASVIFGVNANDVDSEMRRQIKAMSYGLAYGLSSFGLSLQLNISQTQAQSLMDTYFQRFGGIRDYLKMVVEDARKVGYTETIMGRRRYLPDLLSDNRQRREVAERMALNAPIQGSAADIIKLAMLKVETALLQQELRSRLLLQIHDELIVEIVKGEEEIVTTLVKREMAGAYQLRAPLDVSAGLGLTWHDAAH